MPEKVAGIAEQGDVDLAQHPFNRYIGLGSFPSKVYEAEGGAPMTEIKYDLFPAIIAHDEIVKYRTEVARIAQSATAIDSVYVASDAGGPLSSGWFFRIRGRSGEFMLHIGAFAIGLKSKRADELATLERNLSDGNGVGAL